MSSLIGIVNYGIAGNVHSIKKAIEQAGGEVQIINNPTDFKTVGKIVVPGVGSFKGAMRELETDGFIDDLQKTDKPILGICLGMQILTTLGFEYGKTRGLNLVNGEVKPIICDAPVPHVGFNKITIVNESGILSGVEDEEFYFMHSYEVVNYTDVSALSEYAGHEFVAAIQKNNLYGVQFHPEKSRDAGIKLFRNFIAI